MALHLHRPRSVPAKAATFTALYAAAGLLAGLVPLAALPDGWGLGLAVVLLVAAFVVGQQLVQASFLSLFAGLLAAGTFVVLTFYGTHASTLAWRGQQVQATVTHVRITHVNRSTTYSYELADVSGHGIPGHLLEDSNSFGVGDGVVVMVDPGGWVDPETIGEVHAARPIWIIAGIAFVLTAATSFWIALSRPGGRSPATGRHGLRHYHH